MAAVEVKPEGLCITGNDHQWKPRFTMQGYDGRRIAASQYDRCQVCGDSRRSPLFELAVHHRKG